jgi:hypothetical protein
MFRGSIKGHIEALGQCIQHYGATTLLDYGCGKGAQYTDLRVHERWGIPFPALYDPGVPELSVLPEGRFDAVICTDVMEHVIEENVDETIDAVTSRATKFAYFCIFTEPSRKFLPDGRNCHVTVHPPGWWLERIATRVHGSVSEFNVPKSAPSGVENFRHSVITRENLCDIVVTFRGGD